MGALDRALQAARKKLEAVVARDVIYRRIADGSEHSIKAIRSTPERKNRQTNGQFSTERDPCDWIVSFWDLSFMPERSDEVVDGEYVYQVGNRENKQCYRKMGGQETMIRLFTIEK